MLPGAINTGQAFEQDKSKVFIFYCTIGQRSGVTAKAFATNGYQTRNLRGGILAWVEAGQPVYKDGQITKQVHVYSSEWNILPDDYEAVY
jgi:3-mercaptopyruvate sulfurtransferase SseA